MGIVTSEAVELDLQPVGIATRTLAKSLDLVVQLGGFYIVSIVAAVVLSLTASWTFVVFEIVLGFLAVVGYPVALESLTRGRTVGKLALGLRTVTVDGLPIRFRHAAIRGTLELVDLWISFGSVAMPAIVWSRRHQRLGDMVAGTVVLRQRGRRAVAGGTYVAVPPGMEPVAATIDVAGLEPARYEMVRSYLGRWSELQPAARARIGLDLANVVAPAVGYLPRPPVTPDLFLATVAACYQARFGSFPLPAYPPPAHPLPAYPPPAHPTPAYPPPAAAAPVVVAGDAAAPPPQHGGDGFAPPG